MGKNAKADRASSKYPHLTELHITGFPKDLKKDMIEVANDEGSSLGEFIKREMRRIIPKRVGQLGLRDN